ncbi:MAG: divergent PAP2 family protein [Clostridiales bacterium]|nr:divergent PAP2 family protein [Clostridiales bacterium]
MAFKMFILEYKFFFVPFISWWAAQLLKFTITIITKKRVDFTRLTGSGGMPSSHTSATVALAVLIAIELGLASVEFALALAFALVVMYDAAGVRQSTGKQAKILNRLLYHRKGEIRLDEELKELIGHTPFEVIGGAALGFTVAFLIYL